MALAACYTNESYQAQACRALQDWIKRHNKYESKGGGLFNLSVLDDGFTSSFMTPELHRETTDLFIRAARMNNSSEYTEHRHVTEYESPFSQPTKLMRDQLHLLSIDCSSKSSRWNVQRELKVFDIDF